MMRKAVWLKAVVVWLVILLLAILNGVVRENLLMPALGQFGAYLASGALLSLCIVSAAYLSAPWYGRLSVRHW